MSNLPSARKLVVVTVVAAAGLFACSAAIAVGVWAAQPSAAIAPARATTTRIDLGRAVCGDCCETRIWRAVGNRLGVKDVSTTVGESTIVVHHEAKDGLSAALVTALASEWSGATLVADDGAVTPKARQWIRPVMPAR